ncbi:MAG: chromate efflux transporter [Deltaproteobacteria bacterium]|nr:chromate efflux transporter [Deltaproteobacteria bacterium]
MAARFPPGRLAEVAGYFLRLGITAFGGPAAHISMMHAEVVNRRKWLDNQRFLDLLGATNLIPGPNSTEMAIHLGFLRAGWAGLILGGLCFILPAVLVVTALAWAYVRFGSIPEIGSALYGIKPVIIAIIAKALWDLGRKAVKGPLTAAVGIAVLVLYFLGANEIVLLFAGGFAVLFAASIRRMGKGDVAGFFALFAGSGLPALGVVPFSLPVLFLVFLKIGAVLYGSGYVLLAFLRADFVVRLGWLTDRQLLDAVAIGQVTPGPVFTTATFIGYLLGGMPGALLATLGIFLPSFIFVAASFPFVQRLRGSATAGRFLDGVNVASLGLMAAVTWQLGRASFVDPQSVAIGLVSAVLLIRYEVNATWLVLGGAAAGLVHMLLQ